MAVSKTPVFIGALAGAGIAVAAMAGVGLHPAGFSDANQGHLIKASTEPVLPAAPGAPLSFADIFEKVSPAVVSINVTSKADPSAMRRIPGFENFPFDLVPRGQAPGGEGDDGGNGGGADAAKAPKQLSAGSGFFISSEGYIVTNNHVVANADEIKVVLKDGKELKATVVGRDEGTDLAVIKVDGRDFPFVNFEQTARPRVGDWVLAVGNPFSLGSTATAGIVSAYNRDIGENFVDYIQIDAPINRGNSGGPTFDTYGRVIGVNTAIFSPSGGSVGIGFDIPADVASSITKNLMTGQKIRRGYIGATIQNLTDELAESWGMQGRKGAVVADVVPGGPAQHAGLEAGDVVVAVNGHPVTSNTDMTREVAKTQAGDIAHLDVFRDGKARTVDIRTALRPSEAQLAQNGGSVGGDEDQGSGGAGAKPAPNAPILGLYLAPIDPPSREKYSIASTVHGVVVSGVKGSSDAGDKGLRPGDVIVRAGDHDVASASDVTAAVAAWKKAGRTIIPLSVNHGGHNVVVPVKIDG
jgi:serine protease Do